MSISEEENNAGLMLRLQNKLLYNSFLSLFIVASLGLTLRSFPLIHVPMNYKFLLHAHSHFAFSGWIMPMLIWMIMKQFPELTASISYRHWRNIIFIVFLSAYGMLLSFPFQGYGIISIIFSTFSILAGYYLAIVIWRHRNSSIPMKFLKMGLLYMVLSSIGPFATGPLIAMGKSGSAIYFNSIYFYLHFQYNGWFTFAVLACLFRMMEHYPARYGSLAFRFFNLACIPSFFLSVLWDKPSVVFNLIGGIAAVLQLIAMYFLCKAYHISRFKGRERAVMNIALIALAVKLILQLLSSVPVIASVAYENRNFIIAYLHLVLLGFISVFIFTAVLRSAIQRMLFKAALMLFIVTFVITELLLATQATGAVGNFIIPGFSELLFICSIGFPLSTFIMYVSLRPIIHLQQPFPEAEIL